MTLPPPWTLSRDSAARLWVAWCVVDGLRLSVEASTPEALLERVEAVRGRAVVVP